MSRRRPQFIGPPPEEPKVLAAVPHLDHPIYQQKAVDLARKLIGVLHQIDPPIPPSPTSRGRGTYAFKYNAKMFPDYILIRSPNGAGRPVLLEELQPLTSAADWEGFAKKFKAWCDDEANAVMEQQTGDQMYNWIQKMSKGEEQSN